VTGTDDLVRSKRIGWAFGAAGSTTILYVVNVVLVYYLVTAVGMDPILAGSFMLIGRVLDAVADLLIGHFSDQTRSRWGRRRPWMAAGALFSAGGMAWLFSGTAVNGELTLLALLLTFVGYSAFAIPSSAMPAEITRDPEVRTSLMAYRTFFIQVAALAGGALAPAMIAWGGSSPKAFADMGYVIAAFVLFSMSVSVVMTAGVPDVGMRPVAKPSFAGLLQLFDNRPFLVLLGVKSCVFIASACLGATGLFFMRDVALRGETGMSQFALASGIAGTLSVPIWRYLSRFGSKAQVCMVALALSSVTSLSWLLATPGEPEALFYGRGILAGFAATGGLLMTLSMLPDAIEYGVRRSGLRKEGLYAAMFEFFQKAAFAIGPLMVGAFLQWSGYRAGAPVGVAQTGSALNAVRISMAVLPAIAQVLAIVLLLFFYRVPTWAAPDVSETLP
jgi:GPH family glycoside/pentoside/hexuronide:cation symporter